jgi:hypothetical protein
VREREKDEMIERDKGREDDVERRRRLEGRRVGRMEPEEIDRRSQRERRRGMTETRQSKGKKEMEGREREKRITGGEREKEG